MKINSFFGVFLRYFLQGILIVGPLSTTVWIIWSIFSSIDNLVPDVSKKYPGVVFVVLFLGTTLIGFIGSKFFLGRLLVSGLDYLLERIPGIKFIYSSIKDVLTSFVGDNRKFNNPVWVKVQESPEMWRIGFLTQENMDFTNMEGMVSVYLPHSYAVSGWVIVTKAENIKPTEGLSAHKAMEFALSGGMIGGVKGS
ncbi:MULTISPECIES: DUF502 domain-containing protein [Capnocytophaga]|uniref:DUF502 domain-containing protein n=2 Tax=Capnocytophaga TaxID=1016 RepID=A0A250FZB9_9FLAO|nr:MULTISPECIES: DUF502 domain-containing protein [Capnocytophaga]ATA89346.1 hypothetical protein CGC58_06175 [Capnocytophaga stomatis]GET45559.1 membrane protein [Capnocytophaga felis]GIM50888.1 membrane protein [Capnocytophaga stomatis]